MALKTARLTVEEFSWSITLVERRFKEDKEEGLINILSILLLMNYVLLNEGEIYEFTHAFLFDDADNPLFSDVEDLDLLFSDFFATFCAKTRTKYAELKEKPISEIINRTCLSYDFSITPAVCRFEQNKKRGVVHLLSILLRSQIYEKDEIDFFLHYFIINRDTHLDYSRKFAELCNKTIQKCDELKKKETENIEI
jgi:hypothetical protein